MIMLHTSNEVHLKIELGKVVVSIYTGQDMFSLSLLLHNGCWEVLEVKLYLLQLRRNLRTLALNLRIQTGMVICIKISVHTEHITNRRMAISMRMCA